MLKATHMNILNWKMFFVYTMLKTKKQSIISFSITENTEQSVINFETNGSTKGIMYISFNGL